MTLPSGVERDGCRYERLVDTVVSKEWKDTAASLWSLPIKCHCTLLIQYILVPALYMLSLSILGQLTVLKSPSATLSAYGRK